MTKELLSECCDAPPLNPNGEPDRCGHCKDNATFKGKGEKENE